MNETLRRALFRSSLDEPTVAARLGVDPKTVRRWVEGRLPYPRLRWKLAALLGVDETDLWPELAAARRPAALPSEIITVYPHRWSVPRETWQSLFSSATEDISILAYSSLFIAEDAGLVGVLCDKALGGVRVRIALGDPDCPQVAERGSQEGIDAAMAARIRNALVLYRPLSRTGSAEIRLHRTFLYNSLYRGDGEMLVNQHCYGLPAAQSPIMQLDAAHGDQMTRGYLASFERLWTSTIKSQQIAR